MVPDQVGEDDKGKGKGPMLPQGQPEALRYLQRVVDEILAVLFDSRRQSCHGLVLNNFVSCSGFKQLLVQFQVACQVLFDAVDRQEAQPEADPAVGKANGMQHCSVCNILCCLYLALSACSRTWSQYLQCLCQQ